MFGLRELSYKLRFMPYRHYWTRPEMIQALKDLAERIGRVPTVKDVRAAVKDPDPEKRPPSYDTICREFGSWTDALFAAGMGSSFGRRGRRPKDLK